MPADDCMHSCSDRIKVQEGDVVKDMEQEVRYFHGLRGRKAVHPLFPVHISPDRNHGRNTPERAQDKRRADISGVQDDARTLQRVQRLCPDEAMRVGYHADMIYAFPPAR